MSDDAKKVKVVYRPQVFDVPDVDAAKAIILTPERGTTTVGSARFVAWSPEESSGSAAERTALRPLPRRPQ